MNEDTMKLLQECSSGCKMAVESIDEVKEYTQDESLKKILDSYRRKHEKLEREASTLLLEAGRSDKEPGMMASIMSKFMTDFKLMMKNDSHQAGKLMMDGSNMGIQSICKYVNDYAQADDKAKDIAKRLVKIEEEFMLEMKQFM